MDKIDFIGFVVYRVLEDGLMFSNHLVKDNTYNGYRLAIEMAYEDWHDKKSNIVDIVVCPYPCSYFNPIFHANTIDTAHEFDRDEFEYKYYHTISCEYDYD